MCTWCGAPRVARKQKRHFYGAQEEIKFERSLLRSFLLLAAAAAAASTAEAAKRYNAISLAR